MNNKWPSQLLKITYFLYFLFNSTCLRLSLLILLQQPSFYHVIRKTFVKFLLCLISSDLCQEMNQDILQFLWNFQIFIEFKNCQFLAENQALKIIGIKECQWKTLQNLVRSFLTFLKCHLHDIESSQYNH